MQAPDTAISLCAQYSKAPSAISSFADWHAVIDSANTSVDVTRSLPRAGLYYFIAANCDDLGAPLNINYHFVNPHNEELSTTQARFDYFIGVYAIGLVNDCCAAWLQIPLLAASVVFGTFWAALAFIWLANRFGNSALTNGMFQILFFLPVLGMLKSFAMYWFWRALSISGTVVSFCCLRASCLCIQRLA